MVKVLPFQASRFVDWARKYEAQVVDKVDGNLLKVLGSDGLKRCSDPLDFRLAQLKLHIFELCGLKEVKRWRHPGYAFIYEESDIDRPHNP